VLIDLKSLKKNTGELITTLKAKVTPSDAGLLDIGAASINTAVDAAIAVYKA
jgi:hypothetical protein